MRKTRVSLLAFATHPYTMCSSRLTRTFKAARIEYTFPTQLTADSYCNFSETQGANPPLYQTGGGDEENRRRVGYGRFVGGSSIVPDAPNSGADPNAMIIRGCAQYVYLFDLD